MTLYDDTQYVHFLLATEAGRLHGKKLADEYALLLPAGSVLRQDLGLLARAPAGVLVEMPHKKPLRRGLTFSKKLYNRLLSSLRVIIEHAHSGTRRLRMVADTLRLRGEWVRDTVMGVACGLHNRHVTSSHRAYLAYPPAKLPNQSE